MSIDPPEEVPLPEPSAPPVRSGGGSGTIAVLAVCVIIGLIAIVVLLGA